MRTHVLLEVWSDVEYDITVVPLGDPYGRLREELVEVATRQGFRLPRIGEGMFDYFYAFEDYQKSMIGGSSHEEEGLYRRDGCRPEEFDKDYYYVIFEDVGVAT